MGTESEREDLLRVSLYYVITPAALLSAMIGLLRNRQRVRGSISSLHFRASAGDFPNFRQKMKKPHSYQIFCLSDAVDFIQGPTRYGDTFGEQFVTISD